MTENRANSGVRNLRAMFESQNAASSPEPRGRSPAGRVSTDSPRPTSKVRASFVSVEPSGHAARDLGTTKGTADGINNPHAHRRESFSVSEAPGENTVAELKKVVSHEKEARKGSTDIAETIPEQAVETRESSRAPPPIRQTESTMPNLGSIMKGSDFPEPQEAGKGRPKADEPVQAKPQQPDIENVDGKLAKLALQEAPADNPDKAVTGAQEETSLKPADPKDEAAVSGGQALPPPTEVLPSAKTAKSTTTKAEGSTPSKAKVNGASTAAAIAKKPAAISTAKASASKASSAKSPLPKSPGIARMPKTPTTSSKATPPASASKSPAPSKEHSRPTVSKEPTKPAGSKTSRTSLRPSTASTAASTTAKVKAPVVDNKKPTAKPATSAPSDAPKDNTTTSPGGFKKPRPKSPTRPVRLPSHLTAPTASSSAKHGEESTQKLARKPSTVSRPSLPNKTLPAARKQSSRASLAPSTTSTKRPESRTSIRSGADEGFLARMMRPTASSASKTLDKPASPPRRGPSVKAPAKPNTGSESAVAKGKKKVGDIASKAKEAVTNGHSEDHASGVSPTNGTVAETSEPAAPAAPAAPADTEREATPAEQVESSAVELQTPNFEGQAIR